MKRFIVVCLIFTLIWKSSVSFSYEPEETQHATCNIVTKDVEASAKATVTKQLKGICSSSDLKKYFSDLEFNIVRELQDIKLALGIKVSQYYKTLTTYQVPAKNSITDHNPGRTSKSLTYFYDYYDEIDQIKQDTDEQLNSYKLSEDIAIYNDTVVETSEGDLYYYYWKIVDANKLLNKKDIYITSPPFTVLGIFLLYLLYKVH
ncbi:uncharacterized protein LOC143196313 [Rhynchophorus ferrugineus]|uniref:uncharacterized protein LOC143196313 n=1 Tax=Rhynchophorus ferrugineus TaxID=354439 RepID=UPI003FCE487A